MRASSRAPQLPGCESTLWIMHGPGPHRLFFAAWPDAGARARLERVACRLEKDNPGAVRWVRPSRRHLTLCFLASADPFPLRLATCALEAAANVRVPALGWRIDRVESFRARRPPCVATGPDPDHALSFLHRALVDALGDRGVTVAATRGYHPHVTLGYAKSGHALTARPIEPIAFPIHEMVLLHSAPGVREYRQLGCWPLQKL